MTETTEVQKRLTCSIGTKEMGDEFENNSDVSPIVTRDSDTHVSALVGDCELGLAIETQMCVKNIYTGVDGETDACVCIELVVFGHDPIPLYRGSLTELVYLTLQKKVQSFTEQDGNLSNLVGPTREAA